MVLFLLFLNFCGCFSFLLSRMDFNPFRCCRNCSSDQGLAKQQGDESDAGRASMTLLTERGSREYGVPPAASELEAVPLSS